MEQITKVEDLKNLFSDRFSRDEENCTECGNYANGATICEGCKKESEEECTECSGALSECSCWDEESEEALN